MKPNWTNVNQSVVKQSLTSETADQLRDALAVELAEIGNPFEKGPDDTVMLEISASKRCAMRAVLCKHGITAERSWQAKGGAE